MTNRIVSRLLTMRARPPNLSLRTTTWKKSVWRESTFGTAEGTAEESSRSFACGAASGSCAPACCFQSTPPRSRGRPTFSRIGAPDSQWEPVGGWTVAARGEGWPVLPKRVVPREAWVSKNSDNRTRNRGPQADPHSTEMQCLCREGRARPNSMVVWQSKLRHLLERDSFECPDLRRIEA